MTRTPKKLDVAAMARAYAQGLTLSEIGERHGVSHTTVSRQLTKVGVDIRQGGKPTSLNVQVVVDQYLNGGSISGIAALHGVSRQAVRRQLIRAGVLTSKRNVAGRDLYGLASRLQVSPTQLVALLREHGFID